jgi:hypothetical protein
MQMGEEGKGRERRRKGKERKGPDKEREREGEKDGRGAGTGPARGYAQRGREGGEMPVGRRVSFAFVFFLFAVPFFLFGSFSVLFRSPDLSFFLSFAARCKDVTGNGRQGMIPNEHEHKK